MIEIIKIFKENGTLPQTDNRSYLYGYYMKSYGHRFKHVKQLGIDKALLLKSGKISNLNHSFKIYYIWILRFIRKVSLTIGLIK